MQNWLQFTSENSHSIILQLKIKLFTLKQFGINKYIMKRLFQICNRLRDKTLNSLSDKTLNSLSDKTLESINQQFQQLVNFLFFESNEQQERQIQQLSDQLKKAPQATLDQSNQKNQIKLIRIILENGSQITLAISTLVTILGFTPTGIYANSLIAILQSLAARGIFTYLMKTSGVLVSVKLLYRIIKYVKKKGQNDSNNETFIFIFQTLILNV